VAFDIHEIADCHNDLLDLLGQFSGWCKNQSLTSLEVGVNLLEDRNGECRRFSSSRLCLRDHIGSCGMKSQLRITFIHEMQHPTFDNRHDSALLNGRRTLETVCVDTCIVYQPYIAVCASDLYVPRKSSLLRFMASNESVISS
jgi:hypothetical protein